MGFTQSKIKDISQTANKRYITECKYIYTPIPIDMPISIDMNNLYTLPPNLDSSIPEFIKHYIIGFDDIDNDNFQKNIETNGHDLVRNNLVDFYQNKDIQLMANDDARRRNLIKNTVLKIVYSQDMLLIIVNLKNKLLNI